MDTNYVLWHNAFTSLPGSHYPRGFGTRPLAASANTSCTRRVSNSSRVHSLAGFRKSPRPSPSSRQHALLAGCLARSDLTSRISRAMCTFTCQMRDGRRGTDVLLPSAGRSPAVRTKYRGAGRWRRAKGPHPPGAHCAGVDAAARPSDRPSPSRPAGASDSHCGISSSCALTAPMRAPRLSGSFQREQPTHTEDMCTRSGAAVPAAHHDAFCGIGRLARAGLRV